MVAGAARRHHDPVGPTQLLHVDVQTAEASPRLGVVESPAKGVGQRLRLLVNLFEHVVLIDALVPVARRVVDLLHLGTLPVEDLPVLRRQNAQLVVLEMYHPVAPAHEGRRVAGQKMLLVPYAQHERAAEARADKYIGILGAYDREAVGAFEEGQGSPNRLHEVARETAGDEVCDDFGVGVAAEAYPVRHELSAERGIVLDDAVVDDGDEAFAVGVGVGVGVGRRPVGGQTRVADARASRGGPPAQIGDQVGDAAGPFAQVQLAATGKGREAGAVIPAVLKPPQPLRQHRLRLAVAYVTDYTTHPQTPLSGLARQGRRPSCGPVKHEGGLKKRDQSDPGWMRGPPAGFATCAKRSCPSAFWWAGRRGGLHGGRGGQLAHDDL